MLISSLTYLGPGCNAKSILVWYWPVIQVGHPLTLVDHVSPGRVSNHVLVIFDIGILDTCSLWFSSLLGCPSGWEHARKAFGTEPPTLPARQDCCDTFLQSKLYWKCWQLLDWPRQDTFMHFSSSLMSSAVFSLFLCQNNQIKTLCLEEYLERVRVCRFGRSDKFDREEM